MESGIYIIKSSINSKIYIGSAVNIRKRWRDHRAMLIGSTHANVKLQNHVNKYGIDDLVFELLETCNKQELVATEQKWLDQLNPVFNICKVAGSTLGLKFSLSEEAKTKMSISKKGIPRGYAVKVYKGGDNVGAKKVIRTDANGEEKTYPSLSSVNEDGFIFQNVYKAIKGGKIHKGYAWAYQLD